MHNPGCFTITFDNGSHYWCGCECHTNQDLIVPEANFIVLEDADIDNAPEDVTWYPINDPAASWNLPK